MSMRLCHVFTESVNALCAVNIYLTCVCVCGCVCVCACVVFAKVCDVVSGALQAKTAYINVITASSLCCFTIESHTRV